jgi:hypothetical protein
MKKVYSTPQLLIHGDIEEVTQNCDKAGSDTPAGNNDAFPGGGQPCYV